MTQENFLVSLRVSVCLKPGAFASPGLRPAPASDTAKVGADLRSGPLPSISGHSLWSRPGDGFRSALKSILLLRTFLFASAGTPLIFQNEKSSPNHYPPQVRALNSCPLGQQPRDIHSMPVVPHLYREPKFFLTPKIEPK
jgi:hypothetical protein